MAFSRGVSVTATAEHATAADGTFSAAGATAWNGTSAHTVLASGTASVTDATSGGIPYFSSTTAEASSGLLAADSLMIGGGAGAAPFTSANLTFGPTAGQGLYVAAGTATTDVNALNLTQTWNAAGVTFEGLDYTITDTASAAASLAMRVRGGASGTTELLALTKGGALRLAADSTEKLLFGTSTTSGMGSTGTVLFFTPNNTRIFDMNGATGHFNLYTSFSVGWGTSNSTLNPDTNLSRTAAGVVGVGTGANGSTAGSLSLTNTTHAGYSQLTEMTAPAGAANSARLFTQDNGGGKTQLMVIFGSGAAIQLAIEV